MSGNSNVAWACLLGGMLLQLTYMIAPLQRWDWARYLGSAAAPIFVLAKAHNDGVAVSIQEQLQMCGLFTLAFALFFQQRLLPRLGEGMILVWTTVFLCVIAELGEWQSATVYLGLETGLAVVALLIVARELPYVLKIVVYGWFLLVVVAMGVLQFRRSDFSLMVAAGAGQLDYGFALIDGMAGAYIGVHAALLFELLPIPGKGEQWKDFKVRWHGYLDQVVLRFDDQRLDAALALALVVGISLAAFLNHVIRLLPDRILASLVLFSLPIAWRVVSMLKRPAGPLASSRPTASATMDESRSAEGIGSAKHSSKHRRP